MIIALSGVTCVGKSYMMHKISENLGFDRIRTIRTRPKRQGEIEGKDGLFMSDNELDEYIKEGKIAYCFNVFGGRYAYLNDDVYSKRNIIFEMHYTMIDDFKKMRPDIKVIYIFPKDINIPINKVKERNLSFEKEEERIRDIKEQYNAVMNEEKYMNKFDYIYYYDYDNKSEEDIKNIVRKIIEDNEKDE